MARLDVLVSNHARFRAAERCGIGVGLTAHEVRQAITAGRMAVHQPRWAVDDVHSTRRRADRTKAGANRGEHVRWVWPAEETRAYLIVRRGGRWVVITVVAANAPAAAAA